MEEIITIPKKIAKKGDLVIIQKESLKKLTKENKELRSALKAILKGEIALKKGKIRSFREFLRSKFSSYVKNL
jgi:hypothetical protein